MNDVKLLAQLIKNGAIKVPSEVTLDDVKYFYDNYRAIVLPVVRIDTPAGSYTPEEVKNEIRFDRNDLMSFAFDEIVTNIATAFIIAPGLWVSDYSYGLFTQNGVAIEANYNMGVPAYDESYDYTVFPIKISRNASINDIMNSSSAGVVLRIYHNEVA